MAGFPGATVTAFALKMSQGSSLDPSTSFLRPTPKICKEARSNFAEQLRAACEEQEWRTLLLQQGYKFQFGHTYGHLTHNTLGTLEKQMPD
ncbi:ciliary microtubule inner protein 2B [Pterocles gutturalis]